MFQIAALFAETFNFTLYKGE